MNSFIARFAGRWARTLFAIAVVYTAVCVLFMVAGWGGEAVTDFIGAWGSFPVSVVICVLLWPSLFDPALSHRRRRAWRLIFAALVLDLIASVGWGYSALTENVTFGSWPDVLYIFYYPLAAWAFVLLYLDLGGRVAHDARVIDFTTVAIGFGSLLWFTALAPVAAMSGDELMENWSVVGYGIGDAIAIIAGAMVAMQITDWREERPIVWLLIAMVVTLVSDLLWINAELRGTYVIGGASDIGYSVFYRMHVRGRALSARSPPAGRIDARAAGRSARLAAHRRAHGRHHRAARRPAAARQRPVTAADLGAGRGDAAGGGGPGIRHARSGRACIARWPRAASTSA